MRPSKAEGPAPAASPYTDRPMPRGPVRRARRRPARSARSPSSRAVPSLCARPRRKTAPGARRPPPAPGVKTAAEGGGAAPRRVRVHAQADAEGTAPPRPPAVRLLGAQLVVARRLERLRQDTVERDGVV